MSGRLSKLRRRRATEPAGSPDPAVVGAEEQPTTVTPPAVADPALPADVAPDSDAHPGFRDRSQYRRRLRYLRRVRELGFRDLGGLVFDLHRFQRKGEDLVRGKLAALDAVDRELRALERVLQDERAFTDLREPGVAACARCGALHGSDARFCPACGVSLHGPTTLGELAVSATPAVIPPDPAAPVPAAADTTVSASAAARGQQPVSDAAHALGAPAPPTAPEPEPGAASIGHGYDGIPTTAHGEAPAPERS